MADADVIAAAGASLESAVFELTSLMEVCRGLDQGGEAPWVSLLGGMVDRVDRASQDYLTGVNTRALPHLRDLAAATRPNGGMGAVAPMVTKVFAGQSAPSRK